MALKHLAKRVDSPPHIMFARPDRRTVKGDEGEVAKMRLREAIDQEEALLRKKDAVISMLSGWREFAANHVARLTTRQREIMELVLAGYQSKIIAAHLGISRRTVENHRAAIMKKTGSKSLPALTRLALATGWNNDPDRPL
jgi:two-component system CheB/CheR fusion protein